MEREIIQSEIIENRNFSNSLFRLRLERRNIEFIPGQHVSLSINNIRAREYSIASGVSDDYIDILIRLIPNGYLSKELFNLSKKDTIYVGSPIGHFTINDSKTDSDIILIATGSGIAPFISFSQSFPNQSFRIVHGIRSLEDELRRELDTNTDYISCTSQDKHGDFHGRVTTYFQNLKIQKEAKYYLCGNGSMIQDMYNLLNSNKISREKIMYEEYFNN